MRKNEMNRDQNPARSPSATWRPARGHRDGTDFDRGNDYDRDFYGGTHRARGGESDWAGENGLMAFGDAMDSGRRFDVSDRDYPRAYGNYDDMEYGRSTSNERTYNSERGNVQENLRSLSNRSAATGYGTTANVAARGGMFGKGPKGWRRSDERIRDEVCEALSNDHHVDASEIDVKVESGIVTLTGTVGDRHTKRAAESCIEHLSGVEDVRNDLRVQRQGGMLASSSKTAGLS
jgi:hypothetical protein